MKGRELAQTKVRAAYLDAEGGALGHINVISEVDIAKSVGGRPGGCVLPSADENSL